MIHHRHDSRCRNCGEAAPCLRCLEPPAEAGEPRWRLTMFACGIMLLFGFMQLVLAVPE